jgi:hypothetical protein
VAESNAVEAVQHPETAQHHAVAWPQPDVNRHLRREQQIGLAKSNPFH